MNGSLADKRLAKLLSLEDYVYNQDAEKAQKSFKTKSMLSNMLDMGANLAIGSNQPVAQLLGLGYKLTDPIRDQRKYKAPPKRNTFFMDNKYKEMIDKINYANRIKLEKQWKDAAKALAFYGFSTETEGARDYLQELLKGKNKGSNVQWQGNKIT